MILRVEAYADFESVDISAAGNEQWNDAYKHDIPVVRFNGIEIFRHRVEERSPAALVRKKT